VRYTVDVDGKWKHPSQGNNMYIFPGVGLAAVACKVRRVSYRMLNRAGIALAKTLTPEEMSKGIVYPHISRIRQVSLEVAVAVARTAFLEGLAGIKEPVDLERFLSDHMYSPEYVPIIKNPV